MKDIKQIRKNFDLITEKEEKENQKLTALVRAGLYDAKKLPALKKALDKSADKMTGQEKRMLLNLLDSLISQVTSDEQVYRKVKQNVHTMNEAKEDYLTKFDPRFQGKHPSDKDLPTVLILKRKAIRVYPDNQKVALYYSQALDKYVTIPFSDIQTGLNETVQQPKRKKKRVVIGANANEYFKRRGQEVRDKASDALNLLKNKGEYSSKVNRVSSIADRGVKIGGALGVALVHDPLRKAAIKGQIAMKRSAIKSRKQQSNITEEHRELIENAILKAIGKAALKYGDDALKTAGKYGDDAAKAIGKKGSELYKKGKDYGKKIMDKWKNKRQQPKPQKPKKTGTSGKIGKTVAATAGLATAMAAGAAGGSDSSSTQTAKQNFTLKPTTVSSQTYAAKNRSATDERARQKQIAALTNESVIDVLKSMIDNNLQQSKLTFNEQEININNSVAKKIVNVYESVNKTNKKKMEKMLNESATSFNKVLTFAIRQ